MAEQSPPAGQQPPAIGIFTNPISPALHSTQPGGVLPPMGSGAMPGPLGAPHMMGVMNPVPNAGMPAGPGGPGVSLTTSPRIAPQLVPGPSVSLLSGRASSPNRPLMPQVGPGQIPGLQSISPQQQQAMQQQHQLAMQQQQQQQLHAMQQRPMMGGGVGMAGPIGAPHMMQPQMMQPQMMQQQLVPQQRLPQPANPGIRAPAPPQMMQQPPKAGKHQAAKPTKPLKVEDALAYLEHVKTTFASEPKVGRGTHLSSSGGSSCEMLVLLLALARAIVRVRVRVPMPLLLLLLQLLLLLLLLRQSLRGPCHRVSVLRQPPAARPQVYNDFLDIMKDFKNKTIDTPGACSRPGWRICRSQPFQ